MMNVLMSLFFLLPVGLLNYTIYRGIRKWRAPFKLIGLIVQSIFLLAGLVLFYGFVITQPDDRGMFIIIVTSAIVSIIYSINSVELLSRRWSKPLNWLVPVLFALTVMGLFFFFFLTSRRWGELRENNPELLDFVIGGFFTLMATCCVIAIFQIIQDAAWFAKILPRMARKEDIGGEYMNRKTFISKLGLIAGGAVLGSFMYGLTRGKFGFRVVEEEIFFSNLPDAFDGTTVVQISDLHVGSFHYNFDPLIEAVKIINDLTPDFICFTGDLVNTYHTEADAWVPVFRDLKAKEGKFSILGNHDYGYYGDTSEEQQEKCREGVIAVNKEMGFDILVNEHRILEKDGEKIAILGVENWGESHWFPKRGDIAKAKENIPQDVPFKLLLSHDPTHWEAHIQGKEKDIDLTLSGHTHGAQMGLTIPGVLEISPAALMFKRWAGLYTEGLQKLYINRGMGYLMIPGRVGMPPEITKIRLRKG